MKAPVGESAADVIVVLRRMLDLYANIRPAKSYPNMPSLRNDIDMIIVRENTEDLYTGKEFSLGDASVALRIISEKASKRIAKYAFEMAKQRNSMKKVTCVHKSNVMRITDGMFAKSCSEVAKEYPDISFEQMYVDACAMNLIRQPQMFDVVVTTNLFGDILSDESSQVVGGLGMAPAANIGDKFALFEPVHGAARCGRRQLRCGAGEHSGHSAQGARTAVVRPCDGRGASGSGRYHGPPGGRAEGRLRTLGRVAGP